MTTAILDTNVFVQASFSPPQSASYRMILAHEHGRYVLVFSDETIDELLDVLTLPRIRERHGWSDEQILRFVISFLPDATIYSSVPPVSAAVPRDITDTKFLALAAASGVDYLVTNDRRHLLRLKRHGRTQIVTPAQFLRTLS